MKFYKYKPLGKGIDDSYIKNMLLNSEMYLNKPKEFNDPFDCRSDTIYKSDNYCDWYNN